MTQGRYAGEVIAGRYQLDRLLGAGACGEVYEAMEQGQAPRPVAVKVLFAQAAQTFVREAQVLSRLSSPHTVRLFQAGEDARLGLRYLTCELVRGRTLAEELEWPSASLTWARVRHLVDQVLLGLIEAHDQGVVHRDLKPGNIMLTHLSEDPDYVKLLDFGIARLLEAQTQARLTGTPLYISPEQVESPGEVDARADQYGLGCVVWHLCTGAPPFPKGSLQHVLYAQARLPLPPFSPRPELGAPAALEALLRRCLEKAPGARFADARQLRAAWLALGDGSAPAAVGASTGGLATSGTLPAGEGAPGGGGPAPRWQDLDRVVAQATGQVAVRLDLAVPGAPSPPRAVTRDIRLSPKRQRLTVHPGDSLALRIEVAEDSQVYVYDFGTSGAVTPLLPNQYTPGNLVRAGELLVLPTATDPYELTIGEVPGREVIRVYAIARSATAPVLRDVRLRPRPAAPATQLLPAREDPPARAGVAEIEFYVTPR